ncbi:hypothetical protein [Roseomonas indoligenes]|uniref:Uncharacterized protein n=1 Tax=Roseomonas indoligenes TaxID=2820811 RepID=A0A940MYK2_9PROT|nr:hypothetical protein [Pararoseomonas indoligenes]MBP0494033.1 hypothetical protein [Pararoseomonas indoligenes]
MPSASDLKLFDALATVSRAFAEGAVPGNEESPAIEAMDPESRTMLGEAALAVAYGAFARDGDDSGPMHMLVGAIGLMAIGAGEEPDPPAEIMAVLADDDRVEVEIDRAGEAVDTEFPREAAPEALAAALEARIVGSAITLAGCTLPEDAPKGAASQAAVRLRAARYLTRLAAGLLTMNAAAAAPGPAEG